MFAVKLAIVVLALSTAPLATHAATTTPTCNEHGFLCRSPEVFQTCVDNGPPSSPQHCQIGLCYSDCPEECSTAPCSTARCTRAGFHCNTDKTFQVCLDSAPGTPPSPEPYPCPSGTVCSENCNSPGPCTERACPVTCTETRRMPISSGNKTHYYMCSVIARGEVTVTTESCDKETEFNAVIGDCQSTTLGTTPGTTTTQVPTETTTISEITVTIDVFPPETTTTTDSTTTTKVPPPKTTTTITDGTTTTDIATTTEVPPPKTTTDITTTTTVPPPKTTTTITDGTTTTDITTTTGVPPPKTTTTLPQTTTTTTTTTTKPLPSTPKPVKCTSAGRFPHPTDCSIYYFCSANWDGTFTRYEYRCPNNAFFNIYLRYCCYDARYCVTGGRKKALTSTFADFCKSDEARYEDPDSCTHYFLCNLEDGMLIPHRYTCPEGEAFSPEVGRCTEDYPCSRN